MHRMAAAAGIIYVSPVFALRYQSHNFVLLYRLSKWLQIWPSAPLLSCYSQITRAPAHCKFHFNSLPLIQELHVLRTRPMASLCLIGLSWGVASCTRSSSPSVHLLMFLQEIKRRIALLMSLFYRAFSPTTLGCGEPWSSMTCALIWTSSELPTWWFSEFVYLNLQTYFVVLIRFMTRYLRCLLEKKERYQIGFFQWYLSNSQPKMPIESQFCYVWRCANRFSAEQCSISSTPLSFFIWRLHLL